MFTQGDPDQCLQVLRILLEREKIMLSCWLRIYIFDILSRESKLEMSNVFIKFLQS